MGKYTSCMVDLFSIFDSQSWKNENIKTFPEGFVQTGGGTEFIRFDAVSQSRREGNKNLNLNSLHGVIIVDIFVPAGFGPARANTIADILDKHFAGKEIRNSLKGTTQLLSSTLAPKGVDKVNKSLQTYQYSLPFNYFGVQ